MAKFIALAGHTGPIPADFAEQPADPAMFGLPTEDDGSRNDPLLGQNMISCSHYEPDVDALRAASTRIVVAVAAESGARSPAAPGRPPERLGTTPVIFPGNHDGFVGGEYGQTGDPEPFAATLRKVLTSVERTATARPMS